MKKLYIITGAKGHLAGTIIRYLRKENCHIRGLILPTENGEDDRQITYYKGDITRLESMDKIFSDIECNEVIVIHAAGLISIGGEDCSRLYRVNVEGTKNVLKQCMRHHVRRFVYISSVHAIPETEGETAIKESTAFSKEWVKGAYAATKAEATQMVIEMFKKGLDVVIVHPSGIIGPYDAGNNHMVQLISMCIRGRLPAGVAGGYDFVDVRDVAKGCLLAAEKGTPGNCYILSNRYFTVKELLEYVHRITGVKRKLCLPLGIARMFAPFLEWIAKIQGRRPLYTKYALDTLSGNSHFSHAKATLELGYNPRDMYVTVRDTVSWLCGHQDSVSLETM